jgi:protein-disulfide isomerase
MRSALTGIALSGVALVTLEVLRTSGQDVDELSPVRSEATFVPGWRDALDIGLRLGDAEAPVTVVQFMDLQCPACAAFQKVVDSLMWQLPGVVSIVHVHFPLSRFAHSHAAARAADCADDAERFAEFVQILYANQDSIGIRPWASFAADAGIVETAAITECAVGSQPQPRVDVGVALGRAIGVVATPTVIVDGWRFRNTPTLRRLAEVVQLLAAGERPFVRP